VTPTWYDLLGVEPDASPDEIRTAWKAAIADLDPGDRRFRTLNEAAEVLLDANRRAEYDVSLEPNEAAEEQTHVAPPLTRQKLRGGAKRGSAVSDGSAETEAQLAAPDATDGEQGSRDTARRNIPAWLLAALALLTAAALAAAGYLLRQPSDDAIADATSDAQGAAERAVTTILAYDYRHLEDDQQAAGALMTPDYKKKYDALFAQIAANAPDLKASVTAEVVAAGIVRSGEDRVQVLVFVNRPTSRRDLTEPTVYRDQVVLTMVESGSQWLVDNMDTNQLAG
jgi:Mce-associated membrane protein